MKRIFIVIISTLILQCSCAQECTYGNSDTVGFVTNFYFLGDLILGEQVIIDSYGSITSVNLIGKVSTGAQVQIAIYSDRDNHPADLIEVSSIGIVDTGIISIPIIPTSINPGKYWIMTLYDTLGQHTFFNSFDATHSTYAYYLDFGSPFPSTAIDFIDAGNRSMTYFLGVDCDLVDNEVYPDQNIINVYPNPISSFVIIDNPQNQYLEIQIYDISGTLIVERNSSLNQIKIEFSKYTAGTYFFVVNDVEVHKLIKQ